MNPLRPALITVLVVAFALPASGKTWRIRVDGSGDAPTIAAAVAASSDGDSILVGPGTYTWTNQNTVPGDWYAMLQLEPGQENLTIIGEAGPHATILDAQYQGRVLVTKGLNHLTMEGFTLRGGSAPALSDALGGCIVLHISHDVFRNCIFRDNSATTGGVAWVGGLAEPRFIDCEFMENTATFGGALYLTHSSTAFEISRCRFHHNTASGGGGAIYMNRIRGSIDESVFAFNQAPQGGAVYMRSMWAATFSRCTFVGNQGAEAGAFYILASPGIRIERTIVSNGGEGTPYFISFNSSVTFSCTDTYRNPVTNELPAHAIDAGGNFSADPLYCGSTDSMNYTLAQVSPCLPGNHPTGAACGQIGAFGLGCAPVVVRETTWGRIKAMYR